MPPWCDPFILPPGLILTVFVLPAQNPLLSEKHVRHCALSEDFNSKISPLENKIRQYIHNFSTNPETRNESAPESVDEFERLYNSYRDARRAVLKERNDAAKALAEQEKAEKEKAKLEAQKVAAIKAAADKGPFSFLFPSFPIAR